MAAGSAARRYAQAVFEIGQERGTLETWYDDLRRIAEVAGEPDMRRFLLNGRVTRAEKQRVADNTILGISPEARNLVRLLVQKDRLAEAPAILREFEVMFLAAQGIAQARVTTAVPLSEEERDLVRARLGALTGRDIRLTTDVDPSLIGGLVARVGDKLYDGSTRTRLQQLREQLAGRA